MEGTMKKNIIAGLIVCLLGLLSLTSIAQDFSKYESLKEPQINKMEKQRMLVVEAKGDPNVAAKDAFSLLFKTYFSLPGAKMVAPRARWMAAEGGASKNEWVGLYALPLPESITSLPSGVTGVRIEDWEYGEVAEILHIGPYGEEAAAIQKLHKFIQEKGYKIAGPHEEEYLKGPGMAASPADYWTIIRYQVKK
jgi:hypothetical protein